MPVSRRGRTWLVFALTAVVTLVLAHLLDRVAYERLYAPDVYDHDWGRMLRTMGFLPFWLLAALALGLHERGAGADAREGARAGGWRRSRALFLALSPIATGAVGEVLKLFIRRERPWAHGGAYVFRPWSERPFSSAGLSMPSSHSVVAFGAAFALARLFPRAAPVWYVLAAACALTRVAARAHFLSDVTLGALLAWAVVAGVWRWWGGARAAGAAQAPGASSASSLR